MIKGGLLTGAYRHKYSAGFAVVKLGTDKNTGEEFAIKIMALPEVGRQTSDNENTREDIFKEIDILVGMEHENVIYMKEYFEENNKVHHPESTRPKRKTPQFPPEEKTTCQT